MFSLNIKAMFGPYLNRILYKGQTVGILKEKLRTSFSRWILTFGTSSRYLVALPVCFRIAQPGPRKRSSSIIQGQAYDISLSGSGIGILANTISSDGLDALFSADMSSKNLLEIELQLPSQSIHLVAEACRYQKLEKQKFNYLLGAKIIQISDTDKILLAEFLKSLKNRPSKELPIPIKTSL